MNLPTTSPPLALHLSLVFFPLALFALFIVFRSRKSMYTPVGLLAVLALLSAALGLSPGTATAQRVVHALLSATAGASLLHLLALSTPRHPHFTLFTIAPIALLCAATLTALFPPTLLPVVLPPTLAFAYTLSTVPLAVLFLYTRPSDTPASVQLSLSLPFTLPPSPASSSSSFPSTDEKPTLSHPPSSWFPEPEAQPVALPHHRFIALHVLAAQLSSVLSSIFALLALLVQPTIAFPILSTTFTALSLLAILSAYHRLMSLPASTPPTPAYDAYISPLTTPPRPLLPTPLRSPLRIKPKLHRNLTSPKSPTPTYTHTRSPPSASSSFFSPWPRPPPLSLPGAVDPHALGDADAPAPPRAAHMHAHYGVADAYKDARDVRECSYSYTAPHPYSTPDSPESDASSSAPNTSPSTNTSTSAGTRRAYPRTASASASTSASVYTELSLRHPAYPVYPTYTPRHTLPAYGRAWVCPPHEGEGEGLGAERESPDFTDLRDPFASAAPRSGAHVRIVSAVGGGGYRVVGAAVAERKEKGKAKARSVDGHLGGVSEVGVDVYRAASVRGGAGRQASLASAVSGSLSAPGSASSCSSTRAHPGSVKTSTSYTGTITTGSVPASAPAHRTRMSAWGRLPIPLRGTGTGAVACGTSGGTGTLLLPLAGGRGRRGRGKGKGGGAKGNAKGRDGKVKGKDGGAAKGESGESEKEGEERLEESALLAQRLLRSLSLVGGAGG